jgi:putative endonuclease
VKDLAFSPHEAKEPITKVTCRRNAAPPHTPSPSHNQSNMRRVHRYYVYILTSSSRRALYTGITNNLPLRVCQHREALEGFTAHYKVWRLVHYEIFVDVRNAIDREKEIKGWTRGKKNRLVSETNPSWRDLAADFGLETWPPHSK